MAEWLKAAVLKTVVGAIPPGVRIPLSPPPELSVPSSTIIVTVVKSKNPARIIFS
jgi:hypothetical protein